MSDAQLTTASSQPTEGGVGAHSVRFLHTSDWQIGMGRRFLGEDNQRLFDEARLAAVEKLFAVADDRQCEAIVVAGDVFDDNLLAEKTWTRILDVLRNAPVPIYLLPGNHDPLNPASIYHQPSLQQLSPDNGGKVTVLQDSSLRTLREGVEIIGAPLLSKVASEDLVYRALHDLAPAGNTIRIAVGHGHTESRDSVADPSVIDVARLSELAQQRVVDYVALGDTHSAMPLDERGVVWYSGAPEVTDFKEPDGGGESNSGKALVVDVGIDPENPAEPAAVTVEQVEIGQWRFLAMTEGINSPEDAEDFLAKLASLPQPRSTVVKYALRGSIDLMTDIRLETALAEQRPRFAALYERTRLMDLHVSPELSELRGALQLRGYPEIAMENLLAVAEDQREAQGTRDQATDALKLLYRLAAGVQAKES
ncbi:metallophosphoesterase [Corynebacterium urealyticum]|uniref:metallophosphoesterase family protein n=1 Tax=Corynebacterium urealyticum TaxID=43771 RepID=UPI001910ADFF|nr:metallophosphoesterase [Corynebacterium urealyticum]QQE50493.1 metallophosphoesterase [Corynebacterium urealyticum]